MIYFKRLFKAFSIFLLVIATSIFAGCDGGSNNPVSSGISTEPGYRIQLASSFGTVAAGASSVITAKVYEPDGSPIRDGEEVIFASSEGGKFSEEKATTKDGVATVQYTAGDKVGISDSISASCRGAVAILPIVISPF